MAASASSGADACGCHELGCRRPAWGDLHQEVTSCLPRAVGLAPLHKISRRHLEALSGELGMDLASAGVTRYALPGAVNPFVAEPAFGDIWVLDFGGTTIRRIRP